MYSIFSIDGHNCVACIFTRTLPMCVVLKPIHYGNVSVVVDAVVSSSDRKFIEKFFPLEFQWDLFVSFECSSDVQSIWKTLQKNRETLDVRLMKVDRYCMPRKGIWHNIYFAILCDIRLSMRKNSNLRRIQTHFFALWRVQNCIRTFYCAYRIIGALRRRSRMK